MSFHVNFNTHGKDLNDALQAVINENDDTNWVIYAYDKGTYDLRVQATGDDGLEGLCDEFSDGKVQFAYAKVIDPNTELPKFVFIGWCGSGVPELRKAFFNSQLSDVSKFVKSYHVQINARDEADVEPSLIMKRVAESSGANYSVHKEAKKPMPRAEPVGTSYKKTEIPDIAAMQRESMTKDNVPKPVGTNYTPIKTEPRKLSQRWNVQDEDSASKAQAVRAEREQFEKEVREREMQRAQQQSTSQVENSEEEDYKRQQQQQQQEEEEEQRRAQKEEEERLRREREAQQQQQQQEEEEERRRRQLEEDEERARKEQEEQKERLRQQQQEVEEAERRKQQEAEEEKRRQQQQQQEEEERRRQQKAAEEEERLRQQQQRQEEEERRKQEEEEQRRHEVEEADRKEKERLQKQQQEEAALQSQLNETADRAVHASQAAGAAAADPSQQQHQGVSAVVLFDYDADEPNEMTLVEGELITQIDQVDEGWWFGVSEDGTKQGLFPANYVQLLDAEHQDQHADTAAAGNEAGAQQEEPHQQHQQPDDQGHVAVALYDYDAEEDNEISFVEGDVITHIEFVSEDWWQGVDASGKNIGLFPANYVELKQ